MIYPYGDLSLYFLKLLFKVLVSMPGTEIIEQNIQVDHVHILMIILPKYKVSEVVGRMKGQTASGLRKKINWLEKVYWKENVVWSTGYFVSTVGIDEQKLLNYVRWQESQDLGQAKLVF